MTHHRHRWPGRGPARARWHPGRRGRAL